MAQARGAHCRYSLSDKAKNKIGSVGVSHLSKGVWKNLKLLVLSNEALILDDNRING
jgi:hypothetical protein